MTSTFATTNLSTAVAPAAAELTQALLDTGWTATGTAVRVIHIASLSDDSGITVAVFSEAGQVRLNFTSEYRLDGHLRRLAWCAEADRELPTEVLAAVTSANNIAFDGDDDLLPYVGDLLIGAGWRRTSPLEEKWVSPDETRQVMRSDEELEYYDLPWDIRITAGERVTIYAGDETPSLVIAAFALTDVVTA